MMFKITYSSCSSCRSSFCRCSFLRSCTFHLGAQDTIRFVIICMRQITPDERNYEGVLTLSAVARVHGVRRVVATRAFEGQESSVRFSGRICVVADRQRRDSFIAARQNQDRVQNGHVTLHTGH